MPAPDWNPVTAIASREVIPFEGRVWRAHGQRYGATSYEGSRRTTGRYNRGPDRFPEGPIWPVLYLALGRDVCIAELIRNIEPVALERLNNYRVSELHITLSVIVDCTDLAALGLEEDDLLHDRDWEIPLVFPEQLRPSSMIEVINFIEPQLYRP